MNRIVRAYLSASFLSHAGNTAAAVALPLIILTTTGSEFDTGTVAAATALPTVAIGLLAGVVVDRVNRRHAAVLSDVVSAAAVALIPVVDGMIGLSLGWFIALGILGAIGDAPGKTARDAMAPRVARASGMSVERLVAVEQGAYAAAAIAGPATAGVLLAVSGPTTVLWVTAAASAAAAFAGTAIPALVGVVQARDPYVTPSRGSAGMLADLREGWRVLASIPLLVGVIVLATASMLVLGGLQGIILPAYFLDLGREGLMGAFFVALSLGVIGGAGLFAAAGTALPRRGWFLGGLTGILLGAAMIAPLSSPWLVIAGGVVLGLAAGPVNAVLGVLLLEQTPDAARGRIFSLQNSFLLAGAPAGIFLAGAIAERWSPSAAAGAGVVLWLVLVVYAATAPRFRDLGSPVQALSSEEGVHAVG